MPFPHLTWDEPSSSFSPWPTILPLALFPARSGPGGNTILAHASAASARPIHAGYIPWPRASLRDFAPLLDRRHPHPPKPVRNGHRRPHGQPSHGPVRCADQPALLPLEFRFPRARPRLIARDGISARASPPFTSK